MYRNANSTRMIGFAVTTALAGALLTGCTTAAPRADLSAGQAEAALAQGKYRQAITHAEAAVLADPHNPAYRLTLASAYLDAGRFNSAATSFNDALALGDANPRTALLQALALMGGGNLREAATLLNQWEDRIPAGDLGLALALAGQPDRGIHVLSQAIRAGQNNVTMRQNLAYAYALGGRWREARLMAAQDLSGEQLDNRIQSWAEMTQPEAWQTRVAGLLQVPAGIQDAGQPVQLALANTPSVNQLAAEAAPVAEPAPAGELPALAEAPAMPAAAPIHELPPMVAAAAAAPSQVTNSAPTPIAAPAAQPSRAESFERAFLADAPLAQPMTQPAALGEGTRTARKSPAKSKAKTSVNRDQAPQAGETTHLVQLGSFGSEQGARRAWDVYVKKYPDLANRQLVISEAVVRGKQYWRVSAAGFGKSSSAAMCGKVKASGAGCFAYAEGRPLPGAVDTGIRLARR